MLYGPRESQVKDLALAHCVQAKKAVRVPTCARYGLGDLGKVAKVRPSPGEAIVQHHEPFQLVFRRTSSAAGLRPTPSRVLGVRLLKGRVRRETGRMCEVKVLCGEGVANHTAPEFMRGDP